MLSSAMIKIYVIYMLACTHEISNWKLGDITVLKSLQKSYWEQCKYA